MMMNLLKYTLLTFLLSFAACSSDDDGAPNVPNGQPQPGDALELTVSAADFVTDGAPDTRATDNDRTTTFENGDRVGIIILDENSRPIYDNIPYKYDSSNNKWVFDDGDGKGGCYYDPKAKTYIVYYPYSRAADGVTSEDVLKTKFAPKFNQSDIKDYRASDLMVWNSKGHLSSSVTTLDAELEHAFASISLSPIAKYTLEDEPGTKCSPTSLKISDLSLTIGDNVYVPYQTTDGSLRCIVPASINPVIRCFYTFNGTTYGNTINIQDAVAANTRYKSAPEIISNPYTFADAKVGDFYCKKNKDEGYLIPGDVALTNDQKNACVGIVFWVGDATANDQTLKKDHKNCTHGLVVALKDAVEGTTVWQNTYNSVQSWLNNNKRGVYLSVASGTGSSDPLNNIQGYNNTKAIEEFNAANGGNLVQAVVKVAEYRKEVPVPNNSSKWYLPSEKELTLLCGKEVANIWSNESGGTANKDFINGKLSSINSVATTILSARYWSSTENSSNDAFFVHFGNGIVGSSGKSFIYRVRGVLAF